jgi:hypothetical protein
MGGEGIALTFAFFGALLIAERIEKISHRYAALERRERMASKETST